MMPGVSLKILISLSEPICFPYKFRYCKWNPLFLTCLPQAGRRLYVCSPPEADRGEQEGENQPRAHTRSVGRAGRGKYSPPAPLDKFPNSGITGIVWRLQRHWPEAVLVCAVWDCEPRHPKGDRNTPHLWWGMGGGAAILKQVTAARRTGPERNPADYPGIKVNFLSHGAGEPDRRLSEAVKRRNNGSRSEHLNL